MEILAGVVMAFSVVGLFVGLGMMLSAFDDEIPWAGAAVFVGSFVGLVVAGGLLLSAGETYEEKRDRIFNETYLSCMLDHESGRRVLPEVGGPSHYTYLCEGEAWRAVEEELWR